MHKVKSDIILRNKSHACMQEASCGGRPSTQGYSSDAQKKGDKRFLSTKPVTPAISALDYSRKEDRRLSAQEQFSFDSVTKEDLSVDKMKEAEEDKEAYELGTQLQYMMIDEEFEMAETDLDLSFLNSHCDKDDVFTSDALLY